MYSEPYRARSIISGTASLHPNLKDTEKREVLVEHTIVCTKSKLKVTFCCECDFQQLLLLAELQ